MSWGFVLENFFSAGYFLHGRVNFSRVIFGSWPVHAGLEVFAAAMIVVTKVNTHTDRQFLTRYIL